VLLRVPTNLCGSTPPTDDTSLHPAVSYFVPDTARIFHSELFSRLSSLGVPAESTALEEPSGKLLGTMLPIVVVVVAAAAAVVVAFTVRACFTGIQSTCTV